MGSKLGSFQVQHSTEEVWTIFVYFYLLDKLISRWERLENIQIKGKETEKTECPKEMETLSLEKKVIEIANTYMGLDLSPIHSYLATSLFFEKQDTGDTGTHE